MLPFPNANSVVTGLPAFAGNDTVGIAATPNFIADQKDPQ